MGIITLDIVSKSASDRGRVLRQHFINGENIVGAFGAEPFEVRMRNTTGQRVEAKLSLDGTDVANGGEASAEPTGKRWVIEGYGTMSLTAWPERSDGGAAFVFGHVGQSVAAHTHGNLSHQGVIAVAVFVEGAPPVPVFYQHTSFADIASMPVTFNATRGGADFGGESIMRGSAVGAGSQVAQRITTVTGLRMPRLAEVIHVRHMWWDDLQALLNKPQRTVAFGGISGFPATREDPFRGVNLGDTPRVDTLSRFA